MSSGFQEIEEIEDRLCRLEKDSHAPTKLPVDDVVARLTIVEERLDTLLSGTVEVRVDVVGLKNLPYPEAYRQLKEMYTPGSVEFPQNEAEAEATWGKGDYDGPRTLLDRVGYDKRRAEVADAQAKLDRGEPGDAFVDDAVVALIEYRDDLKYIRFLEEQIRDKTGPPVELWQKCLEDSKACGVCGAPNAFRAMIAFNEALGLDNDGNIIDSGDK